MNILLRLIFTSNSRIGGGCMLVIRNLTIKTNNQRVLIDKLNFTCLTSDKIAIIGEEGNGKSTLLKGIADPSWVCDFASIEGSISYGNDVIGYLEQFLPKQWHLCSVMDYLLLDYPTDTLDVEKYGLLNEIYMCCAQIGIELELLDRESMCQLSGGEKVKIQLLKLLLKQPDLLLLDEPTNDLDIETLEWLETFILQQKIPVLFISHDETLLEHCANGILHLEQIVRKTKPKWTFERIGYLEYLEKREDLHTRQNRLAKEEKRAHDIQMEKYRRIYNAVDHAQATISRQNPHGGQLLKKKMKSVKAMERRFENKELTQKVDVEEAITLYFHDTVSLDKNKMVLAYQLNELRIEDKILSKSITLDVYGQDKVVIIGKNGCGKTTLLKKIYEELKHRTDIKVGYMPQNYDELLDMSKSGLEFLCRDKKKETITKVQKHMGSVKFTSDEMMMPISNYSQGQKAKLLLVDMVLKEVNVLLLDEPTRNLSPLSNPVIRDILCNFKGCIISVSHDRKYIAEVSDVVYRLDETGLWQEKTSL